MTSKILRLNGVLSATGQSRSTHYAHCKAGLFTKPIKISARSSGWPESEVEAINGAKISGQSEDQIRALVARLESARHGAGAGK